MLDAYDDEKKTTGKRQPINYNRYVEALELAKKLASKGKFMSVEYDDVNEKLTFHCLIVGVTETDYNKDDLKELSDMIKQFDEASIMPTDKGVDIALSVFNIYA